MSRYGTKAKCQVESLEERHAPTVSIDFLHGGSTLNMINDHLGNLVRIDQNDETDKLSVTWQLLSNASTTLYHPVAIFQSYAISKSIV